MTTAKAGRYNEILLSTNGVLLPNTPVTVRLPNTATPAVLYTDEAKTTTAPNPTTSDSFGNLSFWADWDSHYDLLVNGATVEDVAVTPSATAYAGAFVTYVQGADPTGVADSSLAIRDARDAAGVNGTVVLKPGTYRLANRSIQPLAGQTWVMWGATIVADPYISASNTGIVNHVDRGHIEVFVPDVTLLGGTIDGRKATYPIGQLFGVLILGGSHRARIKGMTIKNMPTHSSGVIYGDGLYLGGRGTHTAVSNDITVEGCVLHDNGRQNCAITGRIERAVINGCHFKGGSTGVDVEDNANAPNEDITITGCSFINHTAAAVNISVGTPTKGVVVSNNVMEQTTAAQQVIFVGAPDCVVTGNRILASGIVTTGAAIQGYSGISDLTIVGNIVRSSGGRGIQTEGRHCVVSNNLIIDAFGYGIVLLGGGTNLMQGSVVVGNSTRDCGSQAAGRDAVMLLESIKDVVCMGNNIRDTRTSPDNVAYGIRNHTSTADFATSTIFGNRITGFATAAIITPNVSGGNNEVFGSTNLRFQGGNVGFFGATPTAKPTGVAVTAAGIHAALVTLGLIGA